MDIQGLYEACRQEAAALVHEACACGLTFGTAESCTGGLVSGFVTGVPGSSEVLLGGIVSYAIAVKRTVLGVDAAILDDPTLGAVSRECALQMAAGATRVLGSDMAVSVTGIAGPGGEEPGKPVGTVWFGLHSSRGQRARVEHFEGTRQEVRLQAVRCALGMLREETEELSRRS